MSLASTAPGLLSESEGYLRAARAFSEEATVDAYLAFEAALAEVQGGLGLIPAEAVAPIRAACRIERIDLDRLRRDAARVGYPIVPLVEQLSEVTGTQGQWVHYGTTTQDAMDTAQVLQLRHAIGDVLTGMDTLAEALVALGDRSGSAVMVGRSKLQHAVPITFGYKVAVWLDQIRRRRARLAAALEAASVLQFGGAVGTLASLGTQGRAVRQRLAARLGLAEAEITWHVSRDRMADLSFALAAGSAALGKIASDIAHMMSTEVGELREPALDGRGSSSTMPQKRNPVICEAILEAARDVQHVPARLLTAMVQEHERGLGHGYTERAALAEAVMQLAGGVDLLGGLITDLEVDEDRMRRNLEATGGLVFAEAVMMHLADRLGRVEAHHLLHQISRTVASEGLTFRDALQQAEIALPDEVLAVESQLAGAREMAEAVLHARET